MFSYDFFFTNLFYNCIEQGQKGDVGPTGPPGRVSFF